MVEIETEKKNSWLSLLTKFIIWIIFFKCYNIVVKNKSEELQKSLVLSDTFQWKSCQIQSKYGSPS